METTANHQKQFHCPTNNTYHLKKTVMWNYRRNTLQYITPNFASSVGCLNGNSFYDRIS